MPTVDHGVVQAEPHWKQRGCSHGHTRRESRAALRKIARRAYLRPGARHWIRCVASIESERKLRHYWRGQRAWRRTYAGFWTVRQKRLSPATRAMLERLGFCESTNRYGIHNPPYSGAFQYLDGTWVRAQWWVPRRYRTGAAYLASPAHQDVVTARFYGAHRGEWACSA